MLRMRALLVLTVLVGLLGMHGTSSATAVGSGHAGSHASPDRTMAMAMAGGQQQYACHDEDGGPGGHHGSHADRTCVSPAVPGAPALPAPADSAPVSTDPAARPSAADLAESAGGRSPPSLAELQLLRI
jgi:hypothetical protein